MGEDDLRRELAYYKRHLDELAAQRIATEHHQWGLQTKLRQKEQGFQLLSRLALAIGPGTEVGSMFRVTVLAIHSALEMDRTVIFVPAGPRSFQPAYFAGLSEDDVERVLNMSFEVPGDLAGGGLLLVNRSTHETPFIRRLRDVFGVETFICVPVMGHREPMGVIFSGRLANHSLIRALDDGDADTFRAISGVLQAVMQNSRLATLEQTERLKAEFYADVAHEFRTPLTLMLGPLSQILAGKWGGVPAPAKERLLVVARNQDRLLKLINQILDLARLEAGATELRAEPVSDMNELVTDCAAHFRPAAEARGLELKLSLDPALCACPLLADREKLERALFNLLSNALKFTDRGHIEVSTALLEGSLQVTVADTGIGISEEDLPHVFDRFRRANTNGLRRSDGSGIGLALVKQMAELHHGRVVAESRKGKWSRFTLTIPFKCAPQSSSLGDGAADIDAAVRPLFDVALTEGAVGGAPLPIDELNQKAEATYDPSKPIVLYVEDDADLRAHVRDSLTDSYNLYLACDGVDGLEKARRYCPDAIITDQMMPQMGGREFLAAVRADADLRSIPLVFLTAQYGTDGRIESLDAGADDYLTKPFHEAELRARIGNLIRARAHERQLAELNRRLRMQVREQTMQLVQAGELEQYLPRAVIERLLRSRDGVRPNPLRRQVTVLVTELSALAAFGDRLDEPAVAAIVNEYLEAVSNICAARGGVIDGLTGGRISALFGAIDDSSPEQAAWLAVQAAFEIRQKTLLLNADARRRGLQIEMPRGIGIGSGSCIVGAFGSDTLRAYTAIGVPARIAAKIHADAAPNAVVCDERSRLLLDHRIRTRITFASNGASTTDRRHEILALVSASDELPCRVPDALPRGRNEIDNRIFRREGEYWTVVYNGSVFRLKDSKGTMYLGRLLARPHLEIHVLELVQSTASSDPDHRHVSPREAAEVGLWPIGSEPVSPLLDDRAKAAYRERLEDLEEQLLEAKNLGDTGRAERAEAERSLLGRELAAAVGLGGRDRRAAAMAERFRVNVTRTTKAVIQKIMLANSDLGRHLSASIRTGTFCSYAPEPGVPDVWDVSW